MVEEVFAQTEDDVLADTREPAYERGLQHPGECVDRQIHDYVAPEPRPVVVAHAVVDGVLDDEQRRDGRCRREHADGRERADAQHAPTQIAREPR